MDQVITQRLLEIGFNAELTLENLIFACNGELDHISYKVPGTNLDWMAVCNSYCDDYMLGVEGETPTIAVAKLLLALNGISIEESP